MARVDRILRVSLCVSLLAAVATHSSTLFAAPADVAQTLIPDDLELRYDELHAKLSPEAAAKLAEIAKTIAPKIMNVSPSAVRAAADDALEGKRDLLASMPIEDAIVYMMMLLSKDAREDMKDMLTSMDATREQRSRLRELYAKVEARAAELRADLGSAPKPKSPVRITSAMLAVEYCLAPDVPVPGPLDVLERAELERLALDLRQRLATAKQASECTQAQIDRVVERTKGVVALVKKLVAKRPP